MTGANHRLQRAFEIGQRLFLRDPWIQKAISISSRFPGEVRIERGGVQLLNLGINVKKSSCDFILDGYHHLRNMKNKLNARFYLENEKFSAQLGGIEVIFTTAEEIFIASEIFLTGTYQFFASGRFVAIDVGMNVGFAALFFATKPEISKVYCFEPFKRTFDQALTNFESNPLLSNKIQSFNYGLNDAASRMTVDYNYENKGQVGIYGTSLILGEVELVDKVNIELREVCSELRNIFGTHPNEDFLIKIDCEGAEYAIVKSLSESGLLGRIRFLFIEWHQKGPEDLVELLRRSGFSVFSQRSPAKNVGMIYASK